MPHAGQLTLKDVAWCAGVEPPRLRAWASNGRLKAKPPFTEYDALVAAVAFSMVQHGVSQKAATAAWKIVQRDVQKLLLAQATKIWVIVSADGPEALAVSSAQKAGSAASKLGRCWVIDTSSAIGRARGRYAGLQATLQTAVAPVSAIGSVRRTS